MYFKTEMRTGLHLQYKIKFNFFHISSYNWLNVLAQNMADVTNITENKIFEKIIKTKNMISLRE